MADAEVTSNKEEDEKTVENKEPTYEEIQRGLYLDPEGGYADAGKGLEAEKKAMMTVPPLHTNSLPTKMYLDNTIVPVTMQALQEVCEARPDNPLEFIAYYILKHNPERKNLKEGSSIGYAHPNDPEASKKPTE